jgi:hypothetical protein
MIRTYLILRPTPGSLEPLVEYYHREGVIEAAIPYGLLLGELAHPRNSAATIAIGSLWANTAAYDSWRSAPERDGLIEGMSGYLDALEPPIGWAEETVHATAIDFTPVYGERPLSVRLTAGQPDFLRQD